MCYLYNLPSIDTCMTPGNYNVFHRRFYNVDLHKQYKLLDFRHILSNIAPELPLIFHLCDIWVLGDIGQEHIGSHRHDTHTIDMDHYSMSRYFGRPYLRACTYSGLRLDANTEDNNPCQTFPGIQQHIQERDTCYDDKRRFRCDMCILNRDRRCIACHVDENHVLKCIFL